jgi:hypothetical protein
VLDLLMLWSSTYIAELERQHGYTACELERVRGWAYGPTFDKWPEDQLPGVLVVCPGIVPPPDRAGDGVYRARWNVQVGCCCSASTQQKSHEFAQLYIAAHKAIVAQHPSLGGNATALRWLDETYDPLSYDDTRSLYAGYATFSIEVDDVLSSLGGPAEPTAPADDPCAPWPLDPEVQTVDVEVDNYPVDQPLPDKEGS